VLAVPCLTAAGARACICSAGQFPQGHVRGRAGLRTRVSSKLTARTPALSAEKQP